MKNKIAAYLQFNALKQHWKTEMLSGFLIFLLALPLSLGIAKASDFPPIYGLITAMFGGVLVSLIMGAPLTIKGPAAGLIVIVAGSVAELGHGNNELGWHLALGAIIVAGVIQVLMGLLKWGKYTDLFPLSAVHGMLAAIGIIIISKQAHILAGFFANDNGGETHDRTAGADCGISKYTSQLLYALANCLHWVNFFGNCLCMALYQTTIS